MIDNRPLTEIMRDHQTQSLFAAEIKHPVFIPPVLQEQKYSCKDAWQFLEDMQDWFMVKDLR